MNRAGSGVPNTEAQYALGLFVIWSVARPQRGRILASLRRDFSVLSEVDIHWSPSCVRRNFERFYSDLDVRGVYHLFNKGSGPLTAVVLRDPAPKISVCETSRGARPVNANFVEAKRRFRSWTQGLDVHCSETPAETRRDIAMLLGNGPGRALPDLPRHGQVCRDLSGNDGWATADQLFAVLNDALTYAVLFERGRPLAELLDTRDRPLQVLCDDAAAAHRILNARPAFRTSPWGGIFEVRVAGRRCPVALRYPGDGFIDERWAHALLADRRLGNTGCYLPGDQDAFDTLAYHVLAHSLTASSLRGELARMALAMGRDDWQAGLLDDPGAADRWLSRLLARRGFQRTSPADPQVSLRRPPDLGAGVPWSARWRIATRRLSGTCASAWLEFRDRGLLCAPWLRGLKRRIAPAEQRAARS